MSQQYYENLCLKTFQDLQNLIKKELDLQKAKLISDSQLENLVQELYIRYSLAVKDLTNCYDQVCHVQKRMLIKNFLDGVTIRLLELKNALVKLQKNEFNYMDDKLIELFQNTFEIEIESAPFQCVPRAKHLQTKIFQETTSSQPIGSIRTNDKQSITIIQTVERFRQAIHKVEELKLSTKWSLAGRKSIVDQSIRNAAAILIQKTWRTYAAHRFYKRLQCQRKMLIGLYEIDRKPMTVFDKLLENQQFRRQLRDRNLEQFLKLCLKVEENIFSKKGDDIVEETEDHIRQWQKDWYNVANTFPDVKLYDFLGKKYPNDKNGGSLPITKGELITPQQYFVEEMKKKKSQKNKKRGEKDVGKNKKVKISKTDKKIPDKNIFNSETILKIRKTCHDVLSVWNDLCQPENFNTDWILIDKYHDVHLQLRPKVDERMRVEHAALRNALDKDKRKKRKKKSKKSKKKKLKKKKNKDLTANRSDDSIIDELISNGIIKKYPEVHLNNFKGDLSFINYDLMSMRQSYTPSLGDVRGLIKTTCVLPLITNISNRPKSVLLAGPRSSGKHILLNSICSDTNSVLMDISTKNIVGKYPGKIGLKMFIHLINKVSKMVQPTVIFMDQADRPFSKKILKEERDFEPKRLKKQLFKQIVKKINPSDRIMLIGLTDTPWSAQLKKLLKVYEKIILIPRPNYQSVYMLWKQLLSPYHSIQKSFDFTSLAKISTNYPIAEINRAVRELMTTDRVIRLEENPLTVHEIQELLHKNCIKIDEKVISKFLKWFEKTPIGKMQKFQLLENTMPVKKPRNKV